MRKKTNGEVVKALKNSDELEAFKKANEVCLVYFGENAEDLKAVESVAREQDDYVFGKIKDKAVMEKEGAKEGMVILYKQFDELKNVMTEKISKKSLVDFANAHSTPLVMKFDDKAAQLMFGKNVPGIILYRDEKAANAKDLDEIMRKAAEKIKGKLQVSTTDIKEGLQARLAEYIGVKAADLPTVRIADTKVDLKKYNMEGEITVDNIVKFVEDWEQGKLKPHLKTQEIPKEQKGPVFTLVGKAFDKEVINNDKDVLVKFYAPWCGHCKKLAPIYEELAKKYKDNDKLLIAECDATENEVEQVSITGFPTIKFWPGGKKSKAIDFNGDRTIDGFEKFLRDHCTNKFEIKTEEKKEEKKEKKEEKKDDKKKGDL
ncbi:MAG: thioredoxin domain-containing protein [archaeon]|nr:thioredoxin domain-containing protein [archaeon]